MPASPAHTPRINSDGQCALRYSAPIPTEELVQKLEADRLTVANATHLVAVRVNELA